jgi:hypothetical protein
MLSLIKGGAGGGLVGGSPSAVTETLIHRQNVESLMRENIRWLRTVAHILGDMQDVGVDQIFEDIE